MNPISPTKAKAVRSAAPVARGRGGHRGTAGKERLAPGALPETLEPAALARQIKKLEGEMLERARNLEFEEAARLRDEIARLKQRELGFA